MSSREDILQNIRRNTQVRYEKPDLSELEKEAIVYPDKVKQFCEIMQQMGGRAVVVEKGDDINELIRRQYPDAKRIASNLKAVSCLGKEQKLACATFHPDDVEKPGDLDERSRHRGRQDRGLRKRSCVDTAGRGAACHLLHCRVFGACTRPQNLVNNMHEAYKRIDTGDYGYGVFISYSPRQPISNRLWLWGPLRRAM